MSDEEKGLLAQILQMMHTLDNRVTMISSHVESIDGIVQAFPHTSEGIPDFRGHRRDHDDRIKSGSSWDDLVSTAWKKVAENIVTAIMILIVLGFTTWQTQQADQRHLDAEMRAELERKKVTEMVEQVQKSVTISQQALKGK